jgi:hypothetical protein
MDALHSPANELEHEYNLIASVDALSGGSL